MTIARDLLSLPVQGACDSKDVWAHHWTLTADWHPVTGWLGEHRDLSCDRAGCGITTIESRWDGVMPVAPNAYLEPDPKENI